MSILVGWIFNLVGWVFYTVSLFDHVHGLLWIAAGLFIASLICFIVGLKEIFS